MIGNIYCDYDGVLVDFEAHTKVLNGHDWNSPIYKDPDKKYQRNKATFENPNFWANCPPMPDFLPLWNVLRKHQPHILTAYPHSMETPVSEHLAKVGKWEWNLKHTHVPLERFHVVLRQHKQLYANTVNLKTDHVMQNILIDDFPSNIVEWNRNRGIGILHENAAKTLAELKKLGIV